MKKKNNIKNKESKIDNTNKKKYLLIASLGSIILLTIILISFSIIPKISIKNEEVTIRYNTNYNDNDYVAKNIFKDYTKKVKIKSNINNKKIGNYEIKYILQYGLIKITKTKKVNVIDDIKPQISLIGGNKKTICPNSEYTEEGYQAIDEYDGDLTNKVIINKNKDNIIYKVKDSSNNEKIITREIEYKDIESPKLELIGTNTIYIYKGTNYNEPGYKAYDNCDKDITKNVEVFGNINTNSIGTYTKTYKITDSSGNKAEKNRQIKVIEKAQYNNRTISGCVIYLTFDDGPSNITSNILNTLISNNIKATFFVTGKVDSYPNILKQEYNYGNTVGLHTYSHNYNYLYSNTTNFFNDIDKINNSIQRITGTKSNIIRFPGGSSNTVSRHYYKGIMSYLTQEALNRGYIYFDWNIDSNDAGSAINNSNQIKNNVINSVHTGANVVLMHDSESHNATSIALPEIINTLKSKNCTFKKIENTTPIIRHRVNN